MVRNLPARWWGLSTVPSNQARHMGRQKTSPEFHLPPFLEWKTAQKLRRLKYIPAYD